MLQKRNWDKSPQVGLNKGIFNGTPLQYSCLENPVDRRACWAAAHGVAKSWTWVSNFTFIFHFSCVGEGNGNPLQCSSLENPRDGGAWWAAVYGVAQSRTWLSSSSSNHGLVVIEIIYFGHLILLTCNIYITICLSHEFRDVPLMHSDFRNTFVFYI